MQHDGKIASKERLMLWYSGACPGTCRGKHKPDTDTGIYWYILLNRHSLGRHWLRSLRSLYLFITFHAGCGYAALLRLWSTLSIQSYSIFLYCIVPKQCKVGSRCLRWYYWRRGENTKILQHRQRILQLHYSEPPSLPLHCQRPPGRGQIM